MDYYIQMSFSTIRPAPSVPLTLEQKVDQILQKLEDLQQQISRLEANRSRPEYPPNVPQPFYGGMSPFSLGMGGMGGMARSSEGMRNEMGGSIPIHPSSGAGMGGAM
jgi:hypothetical protein